MGAAVSGDFAGYGLFHLRGAGKRVAGADGEGRCGSAFSNFGVGLRGQMRDVFAAHIKDAGEMAEAENELWTKVVQNAGKYNDKSPVKH